MDKTGALNEHVRSILIHLSRCVHFNYFSGFATVLIKFPFRKRYDTSNCVFIILPKCYQIPYVVKIGIFGQRKNV